ncbi:RNA polymerase sigma factor [Microscilla marina]|uniref:RNA polymerase sigma-Z factor, putative n=1 Tax=Microscilla marina ATCC 23134 TaxID=313606 RepID=A1ZZS0_MICM2|nr:sigma factor [Microscilla marina]EAY24128.1 RNA polymerase sigma-Z factor, putative [Microscilla marina ATCC 23134]
MFGEDFIKEVNKELYPFIKKILGTFWGYTDINKDIEDVLQESWENFFAKYHEKVSSQEEVRALMFTIAKNKAFYHYRRQNRMMANHSVSNEYAPTIHPDETYELFLSKDIKIILAYLNDQQAFIIRAAMQYEEVHKQDKIVDLIAGDYKKKFGKKLNVASYRKIKERAQKKIKMIVRDGDV